MHVRFSAAALSWFVALSGCLVGEQPVEGDTDGDYLTDEQEIAGWNITVARLPVPCFADPPQEPELVRTLVNSSFQARDTDFDEVDDSTEFQWGSNPRDPDTDGDGFTDRQEIDLNQGGTLAFPSLRLDRVDSDGDCLTDGDELNGTDVPGLGVRASDPTDSDTDGDGFTDPHEVFRSHTDPGNPDTDGDGAREPFDVDPLQNIQIRLEFHRLRLKQESGDVEVGFRFVFSTVGGTHSDDGSTFTASGGQDAPVPAGQSPGLVDVDDATAGEPIRFDFWAQRAEGGVVNLTPGSDARIVHMSVDPDEDRWTAEGGTTGAGGVQGVLETSEARLEFTLTVESATA